MYAEMVQCSGAQQQPDRPLALSHSLCPQPYCVDIQKKENRDEGSFSPFLFYLRDHYNLRLELSIEI